MKIKRKDYETLEAKLAYYKKLCTTRFVVEIEAGKLLDMDLESMAISARYSGPEHNEWISGPVSFRVIAPDYASGYEHFLVSKYLAATPDSPWNIFQHIKLTPTPNMPENEESQDEHP